MKDAIRGAVRSKTIWLNVGLALLSGVELMGSHITVLFGPKVAAAVLLFGAVSNIALRAYTTQALADKSP